MLHTIIFYSSTLFLFEFLEAILAMVQRFFQMPGDRAAVYDALINPQVRS